MFVFELPPAILIGVLVYNLMVYYSYIAILLHVSRSSYMYKVDDSKPSQGTCVLIELSLQVEKFARPLTPLDQLN